ncbi:Chaperone protein ClpC1, chloroplastic, partial [Linum grandiflorum]
MNFTRQHCNRPQISTQNMEERLKTHIIGQEDAVKAVNWAVLRSQSGLANPNRPVASFFFTGPTGVGKTELASALAIELYGSEESLIRLEICDLSKGAQLRREISRKPCSVVLFDHIEKAKEHVWDMLLQILDCGFVTDGCGKKFDFRKAVIIVTSNVGQGAMVEGIPDCDEAARELQVRKELNKVFKSNFLNKIDDILIFKTLTVEDLEKVAEIMVRKLAEWVKLTKGIEVEVSDELKKKIAMEAYDPESGARPLERVIMRLVEDPLANAIMTGLVEDG